MLADANAHARLLNPRTVALVPIDLQYKLLAAVVEPERVLRNVRMLLRLAEVLQIPVTLTTQYANGLGKLHPEIAAAVEGAVATAAASAAGATGVAGITGRTGIAGMTVGSEPDGPNFSAPSEPFDKTSFSCFGDTNFLPHLRERAPNATTLLLCGIESHICVAQTALGALANGYLVHVGADAVSSRTAANWELGLERMERAGAVVSSTEMMVYELLGRAGTAEFKAMLPMLK